MHAFLTFLPKLTHAAVRYLCDSWASCSSRLRSARCCSIASGTNLLDQMTMQAANCGTRQSNSSPGFIDAFPRGSSLNGCKECLDQSLPRSPSGSQEFRHDKCNCGWSHYSGTLRAEDFHKTGWSPDKRQRRTDSPYKVRGQCHVIEVCTKFQWNRAIPGWTDNFANLCTCYLTLWP